MKRTAAILFLLITIIVIYISCSKGGGSTTTPPANPCAGVSGTPGPLFIAVQSVIRTNCATSGCHTTPNPQSAINFSDDCQILSQKDRIKIRAVDGNPTFMPPPPASPLSATDKKKITDWIAAGGLYTN
jgi:uncharacterized membrane protein